MGIRKWRRNKYKRRNVNIGAYSIERDGEGQHIAIVAGTNDEETNEKIGKVNVEIVGSGDNNITGDIIGGRSGEVKVENKGEGAFSSNRGYLSR